MPRTVTLALAAALVLPTAAAAAAPTIDRILPNTVCEPYVVNDVTRFAEAFGNTQFSRFLTDDALVPFLRSLGTGLSWGSSWSKRLGVNADDWKTATAGSVGVAVLHPARDRAV